jgi:hypothetical protein
MKAEIRNPPFHFQEKCAQKSSRIETVNQPPLDMAKALVAGPPLRGGVVRGADGERIPRIIRALNP